LTASLGLKDRGGFARLGFVSATLRFPPKRCTEAIAAGAKQSILPINAQCADAAPAVPGVSSKITGQSF
jgi:hypothetical protein